MDKRKKEISEMSFVNTPVVKVGIVAVSRDCFPESLQ